MQPRPLPGPADGEAAGRPPRRDAARRSAATSTPTPGPGSANRPGQLLFWPPNVSGWDDSRWLDTSRMRARWNIVDYALDGISVDAWDDPYSTTETAEEALARALASWG